jgi:ATP-binding cassette, subfamily C, bacterial LapB
LFPRAASRVGLTSALLRRSFETIDGGLLPAVLLLRDEAACVLLSLAPAADEAVVVYPDLPEVPVTTSLAELQRRYTGVCLLSGLRQRLDARTEHGRPPREGHWFWAALRAHVPLYRDVLLAAGLVNLFALAMPLFSMNVYDRVVPNHALETLWVLVLGISIVLIADSTLRTVRAYFLDLASRRVDIDLSARIMEKVLGMRMEARPASAGSFASNLRSFEGVRDFITSATMTAVIDVPFAVIFLVVITWIAWPLAIPLLLGVGVVVGYAWFTQARMRALTQTTHQAGAMRNAVLIECLVGLETLTALGAEGIMQRKWESTSCSASGRAPVPSSRARPSRCGCSAAAT